MLQTLLNLSFSTDLWSSGPLLISVMRQKALRTLPWLLRGCVLRDKVALAQISAGTKNICEHGSSSKKRYFFVGLDTAIQFSEISYQKLRYETNRNLQ